jgi:aspartate carbamoyltransferase
MPKILKKSSNKKTLKNKDVLSIDQFDKELLSVIFKKAKTFKKGLFSRKELSKHIITLLFVEPSTRTFSSFAAAAKNLGAQTIEFQNPLTTSSMKKGETLEDSVKTLQCYSDLIVMRHPEKGAAKRAADALDIPLINAGDGVGEHPTQALLDVFTIQESFRKLDGIKGLIAGDLLNGRTVHSLIKALALYKGVELFLLSPKQLKITKEDYKNFSARGIKLTEIKTEKEIPKNCQFWYWTRVQKERFADLKEYEKVKNSFIITPKLLKERAGRDTIILHPLPRVGEIEVSVDTDKRAKYFEQMKNGLYIRMALLSEIL